MDEKSLNITEKKLNKLKEIIPDAFAENKIDWKKLKAALCENIEFKNECNILNWTGKSDAFKSGYKTIAEIGKERIRRVIKKIKKKQNGKFDLYGNTEKQDLDFKVFKLKDSNFKIWQTKIEKKNGFFLVNDTEIALVLKKVDKDITKKVIDIKPQKVITIDRLFNNIYQLKTNTALQIKDAGIEFKVM